MQKLFNAYIEMLGYLVTQVDDQRTVGLNQKLYENYVMTGLKCPGFSLWQKAQIAQVAEMDCDTLGVSTFAEAWPFNCLGLPAGTNDQDVGQWLDLLTAGAMAEFESMGTDRSFRRKLIFKLVGQGQIEVSVAHSAMKLGFRDIAQAEYELMLELVSAGWDQWFAARGMYADTGSMPTPDPSARIDVALNQTMHRVGVYAENGLGAGPDSWTSYHLDNLHGEFGPIPESDDRHIDDILDQEDAHQRARDRAHAESHGMTFDEHIAESRVAYQAAQDAEDDRVARAATTLEPAAAEPATPDTVTPVQYANPFNGPTDGGSPSVGTLSYATAASAAISTSSQPIVTSTATGVIDNSGQASVVPADPAVRKSSAIPIRTPGERQDSSDVSPKSGGPARNGESSRSV